MRPPTAPADVRRPALARSLIPPLLLVALAGSLGRPMWAPAAVLCGLAWGVGRWSCGGRSSALWLGTALLLAPAAELVGRGRVPWLGWLVAPLLLIAVADRLAGGWLRRGGAARRGLAAGVWVAAAVGALGLTRDAARMPPLDDDLLVALAGAPAAVATDAAQREAAVALVDATLAAFAAGDGAGDAAAPGVETGLAAALAPVVAEETHVSLWLDDVPMVRGRAAGWSVAEDLHAATRDALASADDPERWRAGIARVRIQIDLAGPVRRVRWRPAWVFAPGLIGALGGGEGRAARVHAPLKQAVYAIEPGIDGVELRAGDARGVVLPSDPVVRGWLTPRVRGRGAKVENLLIHAARDARRAPSAWRERGARLGTFRTTCFGRARPGGPVVSWQRGHPVVEPPDAATIAGGVRAAGGWLVRSLRDDGSFEYELSPPYDDAGGDYNAVRHAGCVVGLYQLASLSAEHPGLLDDPATYRDAGLRAEDWIARRLTSPPGSDGRVAVEYGARGHTAGAAAFAVMLALARPDGPAPPLSLARVEPADLDGLGRFLRAMTDADGHVFETWADARDHDRVPAPAHPYFPGLVVLALAELYGASGDPRWLDGAVAAADAEIARVEAGATPGHWTMQGLRTLYRLTGDERWARANLSMGDRFVADQFPPHAPPFADYHGAYRRTDDVPRTIRAASRSEALGAVVDTARQLGVDAAVYEDALLHASRHLLENQFGGDHGHYLAQPARFRGAVRLGLLDNHCRIDANKHAMLGLAQAWRVAARRAEAGSPVPGAGARTLQPGEPR